jgi:hypothetical protein
MMNAINPAAMGMYAAKQENMMNEIEILSAKTEYTGKGYKVSIMFLFDCDVYDVTGFSDMISLAEMNARREMYAIVSE